jgi:hypothetical protein
VEGDGAAPARRILFGALLDSQRGGWMGGGEERARWWSMPWSGAPRSGFPLLLSFGNYLSDCGAAWVWSPEEREKSA